METAILILQDTLKQQQKQLQNAVDGKKRANEHNYPIYERAITNLKSVIAELEKAIRLLEASDSKTSDDASALPIPDVSKAKRTCPHCGSDKVIMFDADNDLCQKCNRWFPGA